MNWTNEQLDAINQTGTNIIVSAGAGSGKTAVLTERVISKLKEGIKLNELLILTFTNNSAHDMRKKIKKAISKIDYLNMDDNNIDNSFIMTFDAYVLFLVKKYHYLLNLNKDLNLIDNSIIKLKKEEIIKKIFQNKYEENDETFIKLVSNFCSKNDKDIRSLILSIDSNLDLIIKKEDYLNNFVFEKNIDKYFNEYIELILNKKNNLQNLLYNLSFECDSNYYLKIKKLIDPILNTDNYNELKYLTNIEIPRLPNNSSDETKKIKNDIVMIIGDLKTYTEDSKEVLLKNYLSTKEYSNVIIDILIRLNKEINEYKYSHNCFEFSDISRLAINLLEDNPNIKEELKKHFKEIMIDEYQDTNDVQETFISLIENNNVYMVGDIKQSIYQFRNANPIIFKNKYDSYKRKDNGIKIDLNRNFRSRSEVLKSINDIFNKVMDDKIGNADYELEHQMIYGNKDFDIESPSDYKLELLNYSKDKSYSSDEIEAFIIANDIKEKIENKYKIVEDKKLVDCTFSNFCILMDRSTSFDTYKKVFDYMKIPIKIYRDENILLNDETFLIKNILNFIIKLKKQEFDEDFKYCFTSIARSYLFEMTDEEIFLHITNNTIFKTDIYKISNNLAGEINYISNKDLLEKIIFNYNFYENMIKVGKMQDRNIVLNNLLEKASELNKLGVDIFGLNEFFDTLIESNSEIKVPNLLNDNDAVVITNIHKSKGLEYHICYFSGLHKKFNMRDSFEKIIFSKDYGFIMPYVTDNLKDTFVYHLYKEKYILEEISEKIRLFYVSLTRCREKMIMVTSLDEKKLTFDNNKIVDNQTRISYRSFLDIIYSAYNKIEKNIKNIELPIIPSNYLYSKINNIKTSAKEELITINDLELDSEILTKNIYSKSEKELYTKEEIENINLGNRIHYILENFNFSNPNFEFLNNIEKEIITSFLEHPIMTNLKSAQIIKEYEFKYLDEDKEHTGMIDLLLVYDDHIDIIDYKLKYTSDEAYIKQLNGYKKFIENKTMKQTNTYLYSLLNKELIKID